jgi:cytochrome c biogenesis protein CcdA
MAAGEKEMHGERVSAGIRARLSNLYVSLAFIFGFTAVFFIIGLAFQKLMLDLQILHLDSYWEQ